jgi:transposase
VDLLRLGRLAEAWVAPPAVRELRELVRYRAKLRTAHVGLRNQVHAVLAKEGVAVPMTDLFGVAGKHLLATVALGDAYRLRVDSARRLLEAVDREIVAVDTELARRLTGDRGYVAIQRIGGVGPVLAAVFVAEIGDARRFANAARLCSWAGLTPRHRESDERVRRGPITKQGPRLVRWATIEAVARLRGPSALRDHWRRVAERRGTKIGRVWRPASSSRSSTTACATARSAAWPPTRREGSDAARRGLDPVPDPAVDEFDPAVVIFD